MKYRFHVLGMAHVPVSEKYSSCAYTQKFVKFSKMMLSLGHEVFIYGAESSDVPCTQFIQTHTLQEIRDAWGDEGNNEGIGYDWMKEAGFRFTRFNDNPKGQALHDKVIDKMIEEINRIKKFDDFLCLTQGVYHKKVAENVGLVLAVETGVGYIGTFAKFKAYESEFIRNLISGANPIQTLDYKDGTNQKLDGGKTGIGQFYDRVIPNYFDPAHFDATMKKDNYMLYLGRIIPMKGIHICIELAKATGYKLIIAGQGEIEMKPEYKDLVEVVGQADIEKRKQLMGKAKLFLYPTLYLEPFGGATVEANLSGTPVLTTNFGVFPETIQNGINGYRCNTFKDFVRHAKDIMEGEFDTPLRRQIILQFANRYLMDNVRFQYQDWFDDLYPFVLAVKRKIETGEDTDVWYQT